MKRFASVVALFLLTGSAVASPMRGGIRAGLTDDPDSIFVGGFGLMEDLAGVQRLGLELGGDIGFGDEGPYDYITLRFTVNFQYRVPLSGSATAFPLAGVNVYYINLDDCGGFGDCDDTDVGINFGGGFEFNEQFGIQLWVTADHPDITLVGTFSF